MHIKTLISESVDFTPAFDSYPVESHLTNMISISSHVGSRMLGTFAKQYPFFYKYLISRWEKHDMAIRVDMDGTDDYDKPQGTLNIYVKKIPSHFSPDLKSLLKQTVDYIKTHFDVGKVTFEGEFDDGEYEKSGKRVRRPFNKGDKLENLAVIRIPLLKNNAKAYEEPPSMNVSNANAVVVAQILGYESDGDYTSGLIKLKDIPRTIIRLRNLADGKLDALQRPDTVDKGSTQVVKNDDGTAAIKKSQPTVYNIGLSRDRINMYVGRLIEILDYCVKNKLDFTWG